jgi:hypothetical protein
LARIANVLLEYQPVINYLPVAKKDLYQRACSNDGPTIDHWKDIWLSQIKTNKERFGDFHDHSVAQVFGSYKHGAAIIAGSGPSLKVNAQKLKDRKGVPLISCLHNFHYFEELGLEPEFYCTLDAGYDITTEEVTEGGTKEEEWYWERSKDRTLVAYIGTSPKLLAKWQGRILFFNSAMPSQELMDELEKLANFRVFFSTGGNVLGACLYLAKAILGCYSVVFTGADFSFGYPDVADGKASHKFHPWNSKYDKTLGNTLRVTDVFGNKVHTWPSYYNFKAYFDWFAANVPGSYFNASEGGCLGSYDTGNIDKFQYMPLSEALTILNSFYDLEAEIKSRDGKISKVLYP